MLCIRCQRDYDGSSYPHWQKHCWTCKAIVDAQEESAKLTSENEALRKNQMPVGSGHWPIVDAKSEAEIENEELRAQLAEATARAEKAEKLLEISEDYRRAYQDGKYKLYASKSEAVRDAAAEHLPCGEGPLERAVDAVSGSAQLKRMYCREKDRADALAAQVERLRRALETAVREFEAICDGKQEEIRNDISAGESHGWDAAEEHLKEIVTSALAATPAHSLAAVKAEALREWIASVEPPAGRLPSAYWDGYDRGVAHLLNSAGEYADRLEPSRRRSTMTSSESADKLRGIVDSSIGKPTVAGEAMLAGAEALELLAWILGNCEIVNASSNYPYESLDDLRAAKAANK